ncbi:hypothetical protein N658DRAFT_257820 [Parathielavia hyrcaniae]|uniref:Uncharacterized protein n=1 Tax=Parathielavia hyrcaniae TaxID=113614 RepID=A0AAN6PU92_9PEZI|nr:hypothetical protein N658DRAFT_257820 [Parathielavia hyrcaniae]
MLNRGRSCLFPFPLVSVPIASRSVNWPSGGMHARREGVEMDEKGSRLGDVGRSPAYICRERASSRKQRQTRLTRRRGSRGSKEQGLPCSDSWRCGLPDLLRGKSLFGFSRTPHGFSIPLSQSQPAAKGPRPPRPRRQMTCLEGVTAPPGETETADSCRLALGGAGGRAGVRSLGGAASAPPA